MGRTRTLFHALLVLSLVVAASWHVEGLLEDPTRAAFQDADRRLRGEGPGESKRDRQGIVFEVPAGLTALRVGALLDVDGRVTITLIDPHGTERVEHLDGSTFSKNCCWKRIARPHPGSWEAVVLIEGEGAYVLGFYFETK